MLSRTLIVLKRQFTLQFDTVHILKNIRNNLLAVKCFDLPEFNFSSSINLTISAGKWETCCMGNGPHATDLYQIWLIKANFPPLRQTNNVISDPSSDLLSEGYKFVLTGRMQTDCLKRRFSHYRQMSGGRFLVSLNEVINSESIIKMKSLLQHEL